jgi:hypothetical protein
MHLFHVCLRDRAKHIRQYGCNRVCSRLISDTQAATQETSSVHPTIDLDTLELYQSVSAPPGEL